jgi:tetratricopeptide (TPR) repeat protein
MDHSTQLHSRRYGPDSLLGVLLILVVLVAFGPTLDNGFVNYDDDVYVVRNPHVHAGLGASSLSWALTTFELANWHPLAWLSFQVDYQLYGLSPWGFHLTNLLLHAANVLLLYVALWRMTRTAWPSAFVAALFALHPLHVESMAWVAERKDVLSTLFWMLTLLAYARYAALPGIGRYFLVAVVHALGLLAKPMLVTLPLVLLLLDYWPLGRYRPGQWAWPLKNGTGQFAPAAPWQLLAEKVPLLLLASASAALTLVAQYRGGAENSAAELPLRLENAVLAYVRYLGKTLWPMDLAPFYPYPRTLYPAWQVVGAVLILAGVTAAVFRSAPRRPYLLVGWLWFVGTLAPVIGVVQVLGGHALADRYTYVPLIGVFLMAAWALAEWGGSRRGSAVVAGAAGALALAGCLAISWVQEMYWVDSISLWSHTLRVTRDNHLAHYNLGVALENGGEPDRALEQYAEALRIIPNYAKAHINLGILLERRGRLSDAIGHYRAAVAADPSNGGAYNNLGQALAQQGDLDAAVRSCAEAVRIKPDSAPAHSNLGMALVLGGQAGRAAECFRNAVRLQPEVGKFHYDLAYALGQLGQTEESRLEYAQALRLDPRWPVAANEAAWRLTTQPEGRSRFGALGLQFARQICDATQGRDANYLDTLAAAYAETGHFEDARAAAREALRQAAAGFPAGIPAMESRLRLYERRQPFRDTPGKRSKWDTREGKP